MSCWSPFRDKHIGRQDLWRRPLAASRPQRQLQPWNTHTWEHKTAWHEQWLPPAPGKMSGDTHLCSTHWEEHQTWTARLRRTAHSTELVDETDALFFARRIRIVYPEP